MEGLSPNEATPLDSKWFNRLKDAYFEDYEKLSGSGEYRENEKKRFLLTRK